MTNHKDDGGPFHPTFHADKNQTIHFGASFREVAAMHAMAAILSDPDATDDTR